MLNEGLSLCQYTIAPASAPATSEPSAATSPTHGPLVTAAKTPDRGVRLADGVTDTVGEAPDDAPGLGAGEPAAVGVEVEHALRRRTTPTQKLFVIVSSQRFEDSDVMAVCWRTCPLGRLQGVR